MPPFESVLDIPELHGAYEAGIACLEALSDLQFAIQPLAAQELTMRPSPDDVLTLLQLASEREANHLPQMLALAPVSEEITSIRDKPVEYVRNGYRYIKSSAVGLTIWLAHRIQDDLREWGLVDLAKGLNNATEAEDHVHAAALWYARTVEEPSWRPHNLGKGDIKRLTPLADRLDRLAGWRDAFEQVFGSEWIMQLELIADALGAFDRETIVADLEIEFAKAARWRSSWSGEWAPATQDKPSQPFPIVKPPKPNGNDPRDKFCYEKKMEGKPLRWIMSQVKANKNWDDLSTEQAVSAAVKRYEKRHGLSRDAQH